MKEMLSQVETQLQRLVEGSLERLFPTEARDPQLAARILEAMKHNLKPVTDEPFPKDDYIAPHLYTVVLPADQDARQPVRTQLASLLAKNLLEAVENTNIHFLQFPQVHITSNQHLKPGQVIVTAQFAEEPLDETAVYLPPEIAVETAQPVSGGFLIDHHNEVFYLDAPVITIGRQWNADFIIADPRVSRLHAQIRFVDGRFVLFDLGSTGGSFVNGQRVQQQVLFRGDVISLAGVELIFGQDDPEEEHTRPMEKPGFPSEPFP